MRFPLLTNLRNDLGPAHFVERRGGSKVVERNAVQGINAIKKKYSDCGHITGDVGDPLEKFEARSFISSGHFLPNECAHDIHGEPSLGDSSICTFLG